MPAWCLTDRHLLVSLYPQMLKALLAGSAGGRSLAVHPDSKNRGAIALSFIDAPAGTSGPWRGAWGSSCGRSTRAWRDWGSGLGSWGARDEGPMKGTRGAYPGIPR